MVIVADSALQAFAIITLATAQPAGEKTGQTRKIYVVWTKHIQLWAPYFPSAEKICRKQKTLGL